MRTLQDVREHYEIPPSKPRLLVAQTDEYNDDLSEGLPGINDTSAKMTCVIDDLCGCPLNQCLDDLYGCPFNQRLMTCVVDDLCGCLFNQRLMTCGRWPVSPMTYGVAGLCGL